MKKLSWGTKLGIIASIYVIGVLIFVGFSTTQKINLVSKDYYPKEVKYQNRINKIKNAQQMSTPLSIEQLGNNIEIQFPEDMHSNVSGDIILYRPADYESDLKYQISLNKNGTHIINTNKLLKGRYTIKIDWNHKKTDYYKEEAIYLNK
ncbi:FixH family protein [Marinifilum sp. RC60d5]|uniref:FixH family protein n=1 Tax=Marinifilum sp. RC60d5 TaxID=3458414 RepID=UPI0040372A29